MIDIDCKHRNHRHGTFSKCAGLCNFRTRTIPYYSILGIYGMSKILDSRPSKKISGCPAGGSLKSQVF